MCSPLLPLADSWAGIAAKPRRVLVCCRNTKSAWHGSLLLGHAARQAILCVHDLQNAVSQLLAEDKLCVLRHTHEDLIELESPAGAGANHSAGAQQGDEVRE